MYSAAERPRAYAQRPPTVSRRRGAADRNREERKGVWGKPDGFTQVPATAGATDALAARSAAQQRPGGEAGPPGTRAAAAYSRHSGERAGGRGCGCGGHGWPPQPQGRQNAAFAVLRKRPLEPALPRELGKDRAGPHGCGTVPRSTLPTPRSVARA